MMRFITYLLTLPPKAICAAVMLISAAALAAALTSQYGFDLHPCELCIYQRIPYALIVGLGLLGLIMPVVSMPMIGLIGLAFLANSGIAFFHTGVERKWWQGLEGCSAPDMSGSIEDLMARIQSTSVARCDEIPWSMFGLSMANYNVLACVGLAIGCFWYLKSHR